MLTSEGTIFPILLQDMNDHSVASIPENTDSNEGIHLQYQ